MSYLVCKECGGYYELSDDEKPEDFSDICECGGKLSYSDRFQTKNKTSESNKCFKCGKENPPDATFCQECGEQFKNNPISEQSKEEREDKSKSLEKWVKKAAGLIFLLGLLNIFMGSFIFTILYVILGFAIFSSKSLKVLYATGFIILLAGIIQIIVALLGSFLLIFASIITIAFAIAILYTTRKTKKSAKG